MNDKYSHLYAHADRLVDECCPRNCSEKWLALCTGKARFRWDVQALQKGLIDSLWEYLDQIPFQRAVLSMRLLQAYGVDVDTVKHAIAGLELIFAASVISSGFRNTKTTPSAGNPGHSYPVPVLATVAYTARQAAIYFVELDRPSMPRAANTWLLYRFGNAVSKQAMGAAVESHWSSHNDGNRRTREEYLDILSLMVKPLSFELCVDVAFAAMNKIDSETHQLARNAAGHLGLSVRVLDHLHQLLKISDNEMQWDRVVAVNPLLSENHDDLNKMEKLYHIAKEQFSSFNDLSLKCQREIAFPLVEFAEVLVGQKFNVIREIMHEKRI